MFPTNIWNPQGGAAGNLQGSSVNPQSSGVTIQGVQPTSGTSLFQGATGSMSGSPTSSTGSYGLTDGLGTSSPSAADIASQQQAAEAANLKNEIISRRDRANQIFDALTGAVSALVQEKRGRVESDYAREQGAATDAFTKESGNISQAYRGRGLGSSSYRSYALEDAGEAHASALGELGSQRQDALSQVGAEAVGAEARINADRGSLNTINLDDYGDDANALRQLRDNIDQKIRDAEVKQAELGTASGMRGRLDQIAPYGGTLQTLQTALGNLASIAIPKSAKDKIASAIIDNYAPSDRGTWEAFYNEESKKTEQVAAG